jgi:hypothetical protein
MNFIFNINEELASIAVTSTELCSVTASITHQVKNKDFINLFSKIILEINKSYSVIDNSFSPFSNLNNEEKFVAEFNSLHTEFKNNYLLEISKPRKYCDNVYESYVELLQTKEAKTSFPLIKQSFMRLNKLYDKWVDNDCYLGMSIDRAIKLQNNLLNEIAGQKEKDPEDAYILFNIAFNDFDDYLNIIKNNSQKITENLKKNE